MSTHTQKPQSTRPSTARAGAPGTVVLALTAAWSVFMLIMAALWATGTVEAPFGNDLPGQFTSVLDHLPVAVGAGLIGFVALASGAASAVLLTVPRLRRPEAVGLFTLGLTTVTTLVFTDTLLLAYLGYSLSLQFPPIPAEALWQGVFVIGAGLWIAAWAILDRRSRVHGTAEGEGTAEGQRANSATEVRGSVRVTPDARIAVAVALLVPLFYASTRILWALGIPLGLSAEFYAKGLEVGLWRAGLSLALAGVVGALLTLGLVQRWGERFPRWMGPLAGRRVPILLATIPATLISVAIFTGGAGMARDVLFSDIGIPGSWTTYGPVLLFPLWGLALGWATYRYRARRLGKEA